MSIFPCACLFRAWTFLNYLGQKNRVEGHTFPHIKTYYKGQHSKERGAGLEVDMHSKGLDVSLETNSCPCGQWTFVKVGSLLNGERTLSSTNVLGQLDVHTQQRARLDPYLTPDTVNSNQINNITLRAKTIKLLKGGKSSQPRFDRGFLDKIPKA